MAKKFEQYQDYLSRLLLAQSDFEGTEYIRDVAKTVTFQITDSCNLCCTYCYQINKGKRIMSIEQLNNFLIYLLKILIKKTHTLHYLLLLLLL